MATSEDHIKLVKRYAAALFELACEAKDKAAISKDLLTLGAILTASNDLTTALNNPTISARSLANAISAIAAKAKLNKITADFLAVLASNKRLGLLADVIVQFESLNRAANGETLVQISSAKKLAASEKAAICKSLGKKITLEESIDSSLLAGFTIKSGSRMLDASLKGKLDRMQLHLTSN